MSYAVANRNRGGRDVRAPQEETNRRSSLISLWSLFSILSVGSVASTGSAASIASVGSFLSFASTGSAFSAFSVGSTLTIGCDHAFMKVCLWQDEEEEAGSGESGSGS